jgi:hypothetical protein
MCKNITLFFKKKYFIHFFLTFSKRGCYWFIKVFNSLQNRISGLKKAAANTGSAKVAVHCFANTFVVNQTLVFQIKFCGKSPALRVAAKRV